MATLAFLLLIAALVLFIISTRQWAIWMRGAVWGGGLLLLIVGWLLLGSTARDPELGLAFADFFAHIGNPGESLLGRMLESNGDSVARIVLSLFDIFVILGILVAILALVAFSPGEAMEKAIRPIMIGMIGAILGTLVGLAIVGAGFGTIREQRAYAGPVVSETVYSGDRLLLNGDIIRLRGIRAPEPAQNCRIGGRIQECGAEATREMRRILEGAFVMCVREGEVRPQPTGGDRFVTCTAVRGGREFSIAARMAESGFVAPDGDAYRREYEEARRAQRGLIRSCALHPDRWERLTNAQRRDFEERGIHQAAWRWDAFGPCPVRSTPPQNTPRRKAPN